MSECPDFCGKTGLLQLAQISRNIVLSGSLNDSSIPFAGRVFD